MIITVSFPPGTIFTSDKIVQLGKNIEQEFNMKCFKQSVSSKSHDDII